MSTTSTIVSKLRKNSKALLTAAVALTVLLNFGGLGSLSSNKNIDAANPINIWWPTNNVSVTGVQPFKAALPNFDVNNYTMYWQVDGGQLNQMDNNSTDYPHKQADVDLSGWNWHGTGPYHLNFIAKDASGAVIGEGSSDIYIGGSAPADASNGQVSATTAVNSNTASASATASTQSGYYSINVLSPADGANISGVQPLKATIDGLSISNYQMYWQVDGGQTNQMDNNSSGGAHKQSDIDFSGWRWRGSGPYKITLTAKNSSGVLGTKSFNIFVGGNSGTTAPMQTAAPQTAAALQGPVINTFASAAQITAANLLSSANNSGDPLADQKLWVDPNSDPSKAVQQMSGTDKTLMQKVAAGAETQWFSTDWISNMQQAVRNYVSAAQSSGAVPTMVLYNIPFRDCGQYSAGGANDPSSYDRIVDQFAAGIGSARAGVIVEPDALTLTTCLSGSQMQQRYDMLKYAVQKLASLPNTAVYLDIGHPGWKTPQEAANLLASAGVQAANGFALNVSNFNTDQENISYGTQISDALAKLGISGKHFVVDSGRNGNGSNGQWCNPGGRALGRLPTTNTGNSLVDAFLWVKGPGGSDGNCNGGPSAGQFWPQYAEDLARNAHW